MKTSNNLRTTLDLGSHINASAQPPLEAVGCTPLFGPGPLPRLNIQTTLPDRYPQMYMSAPLHLPPFVEAVRTR
jgi:hypothetical protein